MDSSTKNCETQQQTAYKIFRNTADKCMSEVTNHKKSQRYPRQGGFQMIFQVPFSSAAPLQKGITKYSYAKTLFKKRCCFIYLISCFPEQFSCAFLESCHS